ncbi:MAG: hypothetical protein E2O54_10020 [Gammaproteobacteria bacterium]|nr:MAG: hypothetical protein E2O58_09045 [Gammaproteobacteria bacterium]TDJ39653.1 MAG: hypothetical protein E2O54_10020 [Gammaproteobacteria bacterium]
MTRYLLRYMLLVAAFALTTYGLIAWHEFDYGFSAIWPFSGPPALHPLHVLAVGVAMIPASLWEIFAIDHSRRKDV